MIHETLPAFSAEQFARAHMLLATRVNEMMGRKLEEADWSQVYCTAKEIPNSSWSNTDIDVMYGNLGVEQKALCRRTGSPIKEACGTTIMHPAGTRAIRIPIEQNATLAARDILGQYGSLINRRRMQVSIINCFHHGIYSREQAISELQKHIPGMSRASARKRLPAMALPTSEALLSPDLRTGWLLWQDSLREFLYFEEPMVVPDPEQYVAEWNSNPGNGSRLKSRNLWIYDSLSKEKRLSVTTEAGAKIQPYFRVPGPDDPNLYHFIVQGEMAGDGFTRVWLSQNTAKLLREALGSLDPNALRKAVNAVETEEKQEAASYSFGALAVAFLIETPSYLKLKETFMGVSDEHNFQQLAEHIRTIPPA